MNQFGPLLKHGLIELGLALPDPALKQLAGYLELLVKWNRVYNLTAIRDEGKLVSHHVLDSLAVVGHLPEGNVVDVGSGAGLPGIPIAISCPERAVTLLDSNQKKSAFLTQAIAELGLVRAQVVTARAEAFRPVTLFSSVISRAFSDLADFVKLAGGLCAPDGLLLAMKGQRPDEEIARLPPGWKVEQALRLKIPQMEAVRHLIMLRPCDPNPAD